ncbi:MAG: hypothetical protein NZ734_03780 [Paracoccus sp.]|nr:hypothetical protein [Paracoccus sp. (in: a-proteobacteria)]
MAWPELPDDLSMDSIAVRVWLRARGGKGWGAGSGHRRAFRRFKDWRRIANRHDKRARNFETAVAIAASSLCRT